LKKNSKIAELETLKVLEENKIVNTTWEKSFDKSGDIIYKELDNHDLKNKID
jgi:hypothetical protein